MLQFIAGVIIGGVIGFIISATSCADAKPSCDDRTSDVEEGECNAHR